MKPSVPSPREKVGSDVDCSLEKPVFSAFVFDGHVLLMGSDVQAPVKILRDTGAFNLL